MQYDRWQSCPRREVILVGSVNGRHLRWALFRLLIVTMGFLSSWHLLSSITPSYLLYLKDDLASSTSSTTGRRLGLRVAGLAGNLNTTLTSKTKKDDDDSKLRIAIFARRILCVQLGLYRGSRRAAVLRIFFQWSSYRTPNQRPETPAPLMIDFVVIQVTSLYFQ